MAFRRKEYTDQELLNKLKDGTLPPADFTHEAHVRLVWIIQKNTPENEVTSEVSRIIKHYAEAIGEGTIYHETLTYASVMIILSHMKHKDYANFNEFLIDNPLLTQDFKSLINRHYSPELIHSELAKKEVLAPDILPF